MAKRVTSYKHAWRREENGEIDVWAYESGFHNGPVCEVCGHHFCINCVSNEDEALAEEGCLEHEVCSECGMTLHKIWKYCPKCGYLED